MAQVLHLIRQAVVQLDDHCASLSVKRVRAQSGHPTFSSSSTAYQQCHNHATCLRKVVVGDYSLQVEHVHDLSEVMDWLQVLNSATLHGNPATHID
jgi:hypothetical protein